MRHMGLIENGVPQKIIMFYRHFPHWHSHLIWIWAELENRPRTDRKIVGSWRSRYGARKNSMDSMDYPTWLWLTVRHGSHGMGPNRNRRFTGFTGLPINSMVMFHGYVTVITRGYIYIYYMYYICAMVIFLYFCDSIIIFMLLSRDWMVFLVTPFLDGSMDSDCDGMTIAAIAPFRPQYHQHCWRYPLVNIQKAIENGP